MHWTLLVIGLCSAWAMAGGAWRRGSAALAAEWMTGQAYYLSTGDSLPLTLYWFLDPLVLYALFRWRGSTLDWFIMGVFPLCWWAYLELNGAQQWWFLWAVTRAQLFLAGPWKAAQTAVFSVTHGPLRRGQLV